MSGENDHISTIGVLFSKQKIKVIFYIRMNTRWLNYPNQKYDYFDTQCSMFITV